MAYSAGDIAKCLINAAHGRGDGITHLKLQKLLYYVQGVYMAVQGRPAFDEDILAWKHGPVVHSAYAEYKRFGRNAIPAQEVGADCLSGLDARLVQEIYEKYRGYSAAELVGKTHEEAPYKGAGLDDVISLDSIRDYFQRTVFAPERMFADAPIVDALPAECHDGLEDAWHDEWKRANGKAV